MKKVARILKALEKAAKEMIKLQQGYNDHKYTAPSKLTGRLIEFYDTNYFPAKMAEWAEHGHGYFTPWHYISDRFYDAFNRLNDEEQFSFIKNISKYTHIFACVKAGYMYNFSHIYAEWGYGPSLEDDWYLGNFDEDGYEYDIAKDEERYLHFANIKLKNHIDLLEKTIYDGLWTEACPGHHKVLRMKHNPW